MLKHEALLLMTHLSSERIIILQKKIFILYVDSDEVSVLTLAVSIFYSRQDDRATNLRADQNSLTTVNQSLLNVPLTPGDVPQVRIACPSPRTTSTKRT